MIGSVNTMASLMAVQVLSILRPALVVQSSRDSQQTPSP